MGLLLCFFLAWDLRAVATDRSPLPTDSVLEPASLLHDLLEPPAGGTLELPLLKGWLADEKKGPLSSVVALLGVGLAGDPLVGSRLPGVLVHGGSLALVGIMAARLAGGWSAGVVALLLAGVTPGSFAWHRMDVHDALLSAPLLGILWLLVWPPRRARGALLLGALVGAAALLKVGIALFLLGPGLVYIMERAGRRGERGRLLLTAGAATLLLLPWVILAAGTLATYMGLSSHDKQSLPMWPRIYHYTVMAPLGWLFLSGALVSWIVLWRTRGVSRRFLLMAGLMAGGGVTLLVVAFDPMVRYMTPIFPVLALIIALALHRGMVLLATVWRPALAVQTAALGGVLLLGLYVQANLRAPTNEVRERMVSQGMLFPDQRPHDGLRKLIVRMKRDGIRSLDLNDSVLQGPCPVTANYIWRRRGFHIPWVGGEEARRWLERGGVAHLLICHDEVDGPLLLEPLLSVRQERGQLARVHAALLKTPFRVVASARDANRHVIALLRFQKKAKGAEHELSTPSAK